MNRLLDDPRLMESHIRVFDPRNLRRVDRLETLLLMVLVVFGLVILYSADYSLTGVPHYAKQAVYFALGASLAAMIICLDYRFLVSLGPLIYGASLGLLLLVLVFGVEARGGARWFNLGPVRYQPSEFTKVALVFMLAWYLAKVGPRIQKIPYLLLAFAIAGVPFILILKQNDLGTGMVLAPLVAAMVYTAGCKRWHIAVLVILALVAAPMAWSQLKPYHRERIMTFVNPDRDPQGQGWQPRQTRITVGSGQLTGKGYLKGTQTHLRWLPEHHTDFIFSLLAEEFGFVGGMALLVLMAAFLLRGLEFARRCPEPSGTLLCVGACTILAVHLFVNVAVTLAIFPVMGIPLPFLSYGGSFCLTTMMCAGVILCVPMRKRTFTA